MCLVSQYEKVYQLSSETREDFLSGDREWEMGFTEDKLYLDTASL